MLPWRAHLLRIQLAAASGWFLAGFVFCVLIAAVGPMALGMSTYTVRSGSMSPAIETGDVVIARTISPERAVVGDVITFEDPEGSGALITHRVRAISERAGVINFTTRGDANNTFERWSTPSDGSLGQVSYRIPLLGYALGAIGSTAGKLGLIVVPALLLCALGLLRIWAPERATQRRTAGAGR